MKHSQQIHLADVQAVYSGPEGRLWELLMGEQIHIGGLQSSMDLAERAGIARRLARRGPLLLQRRGHAFPAALPQRGAHDRRGRHARMLALARQRAADEGVADRIAFVEADVCATGLPGGQLRFRLGRGRLVLRRGQAQADRRGGPAGQAGRRDRLHRLDGRPGPMTADEAKRYLAFMKFPSVLSLDEYSALLQANGCAVRVAQDTGRFPQYVPLYLDMIEKQLTYDALKIIGFDRAGRQRSSARCASCRSLAEAGKIIQGLIVAQKARLAVLLEVFCYQSVGAAWNGSRRTAWNRAASGPRSTDPAGRSAGRRLRLRAADSRSLAEAHPDAAVVFTTACDQMRRAADAVGAEPARAYFLFNLPATWQIARGAPALPCASSTRLGSSWMRSAAARPPPRTRSRHARLGSAPRSGCASFIPQSSARGKAPRRWPASSTTARSPTGSARRHHRSGVPAGPGGRAAAARRNWTLFDAIEARRRPRGAERHRAGRALSAAALAALASGPGRRSARWPTITSTTRVDVFHRPNSRLYAWLGPRLAERACAASCSGVHVGCDLWRAEAASLREAFGLPVLVLDAHEARGASTRATLNPACSRLRGIAADDRPAPPNSPSTNGTRATRELVRAGLARTGLRRPAAPARRAGR